MAWRKGGLKSMNTIGYKIKKTIIYICLILLAAACLLPFLLMMINSTRSGVEITTGFTFIPSTHLKENWEQLFDYMNLFRGMGNSLLIAIPATILSGYFSSITAYAMAIYKFKGNKIIFGVIVVFMMIPAQLSLIGFYNLCMTLKLIDSYIPLIVPAIAAPGTVFFLRQYVQATLSPALLEAARIDGAKEIGIFHKIVLPIMMPGIATMSIGAFIGNWNNYLVPLILLNTPSKMTLPVMISTLRAATNLQANQGAIYLGVAISVLPILIAFCFFSKYIISSISAGGVKE
jgi:multiple sugar transport system permease protein